MLGRRQQGSASSRVEDILEASWSDDKLAHGIAELARATYSLRSAAAPVSFPMADFEALSEHMQIELEPVRIERMALRDALASIGPAVVRISATTAGRRFLLVLSSSRTRLVVLTPTFAQQRVALADVLATFSTDADSRQELDWLAEVVPSSRRLARARQVLDRSAGQSADIWLLRMDPGTSFGKQLWTARVPQRAVLAFVLSLLQVSCIGLAWVILTRSTLQDHFEPAWLLAFGLAYGSTVPISFGIHCLAGEALRRGSALLKRRLLCGTLRLDPAAIRTRGTARLHTLVSETAAFENMGLENAFSCVLAGVQLVSAAVLLGLGAGGLPHSALLAAYSGGGLWLAARHIAVRRRWSEQRFELGQRFLEQVAGHRTRAVQQRRERWHEVDDQDHAAYLEESRILDSSVIFLDTAMARAWLAIAFVSLIPVVLKPVGADQLALSIGGALQAYAALTTLGQQAAPVAAALVAWTKLAELYHAAARIAQPRAANAGSTCDARNEAVLDVRGISYGHQQGGPPVLRDTTLTLHERERVLLLGESGGGKSTFGALLMGLRVPWSGQILLHGFDRVTLGAQEWQRRITGAPQFHENHMLSGTLAFNLLLGRHWPPSAADLADAEALCRELGLGPILDRMPAGLHQIVGECGWQLSHGERGRVFLARALLQNADVVILDESFDALDPLTLRLCMETVMRRAPALILIAHP